MSTRAPAKRTSRTVALPRAQRDRTDASLVLTATGLLIIGLIMSLSASSIVSAESTGSAFTLFARQFLWAALGTGALLVGWRLDYRKLKGFAYVAMPAMWFLLVVVLAAGQVIGGARRWIGVGSFSLQPSEAAKLVVILFGADVLSRKIGKLDDWRHILLPFLAAAGFTCVLIVLEPDFGTMMITAAVALAMAFLAGSDLRALGKMSLVAIVVSVPVFFAESYRVRRLFSFSSGVKDCLNDAYQACQGQIALGSGHFFGLGLGSSRQKYSFLPNASTDFIYAIIGEETGLVGALTVLLLFALLIVLGVRAARRAPDPFGYLIASGVTALIGLQVVINIGAVAGILPITGVPLPLISFGGTSLLVSLAGLGLVASVARHGTTPPRRATAGRAPKA